MVRRKISRKVPKALKAVLGLLFLAIITSLVMLVRLYTTIFAPVTIPADDNSIIFYISTGSEYEGVINNLNDMGLIKDIDRFNWLARKKNYPNNVRPGRYRIYTHMNNNELINLLRSGRQEPVRLVFNTLRNLNELAGIAGRHLESDSLVFAETFQSSVLPERYSLTNETFSALFIPNTYEIYWNTNPEKFVERMHTEFRSFWSEERRKKANEAGFTPVEVITLASIVEQESLHQDENPKIAGVFVNRLQRGIPLQSDPTVIFANQDYTIRRVLNKHKDINSMYNTYKHAGLPPGPICIPSIAAIDAVLNYEKHNYLFFCAKEDFSGYHNFARTLAQHNRNARLYQQALNRAKIFN